MLQYYLFSVVIYIVSYIIKNFVYEKQAKKFGYLKKMKEKLEEALSFSVLPTNAPADLIKEFKTDKIISVIVNIVPILVVAIIAIIPIINIFETLKQLLATYVCCSDKEECVEFFVKHLEKNEEYIKVKDFKEHYDFRIQQFDENIMKDALIIDGASDEEIKEELEKAKNKLPLLSEKKYSELVAMNEAEDFLLEIDSSVGLSLVERKKLYLKYVRDFLNKFDKDDDCKAIQKTLEIKNCQNENN